uniref:EGF-like domain-containing protein n=1 Tax=Heterorhabditis bacteriophora TaxID=37862 RepID=A0A1I7XLN5_HETBA
MSVSKSSETPRCSKCSVHAHCAQSPTSGGWQCKCNAGYHGNGHLCVSMASCLDDRSLCDSHAECVPGEGGHYVCNCHYGYHGDGRTCTPDSEARGDTLLVARGMAIFQRGTNSEIPGKQLEICTTGHSIRSSSLNGTDHKSFYAEDLNSPEGIAVDWSSRNVYYADSLNDEIGVASLDGKYKKALITEGLVNPRSVALDIQNRHLFYTDWHRENPFIGRVDMDGKNNAVFLNDDIHLPNGITILPNRRELCWVDAGNHRLSCIGVDGKHRRVVFAPLQYPFGLTHDKENKFYWTDWKEYAFRITTYTFLFYMTAIVLADLFQQQQHVPSTMEDALIFVFPVKKVFTVNVRQM